MLCWRSGGAQVREGHKDKGQSSKKQVGRQREPEHKAQQIQQQGNTLIPGLQTGLADGERAMRSSHDAKEGSRCLTGGLGVGSSGTKASLAPSTCLPLCRVQGTFPEWSL